MAVIEKIIGDRDWGICRRCHPDSGFIEWVSPLVVRLIPATENEWRELMAEADRMQAESDRIGREMIARMDNPVYHHMGSFKIDGGKPIYEDGCRCPFCARFREKKVNSMAKGKARQRNAPKQDGVV